MLTCSNDQLNRALRPRLPEGSATAKALDYSLNRWPALTRYLEDARLPIDNNHDEQQIRPWATGRKNWLFAGTLAPASARRRSPA
jgi:transposase